MNDKNIFCLLVRRHYSEHRYQPVLLNTGVCYCPDGMFLYDLLVKKSKYCERYGYVISEHYKLQYEIVIVFTWLCMHMF